ncbi:MAG: hypothetical protein ACI9BS_001913, partial [Candidatus Poriferisodalaceae bacterium]
YFSALVTTHSVSYGEQTGICVHCILISSSYATLIGGGAPTEV